MSKKKRNRTKKVILFNSPDCQSVRINIGKEFLHLIDKYFKNDNMKKIFKRNNCKISYCCMDNVKSLISRHNKKILSRACSKNNQKINTCNCREKNSCPLNGNCLQENVIYKAMITSQNESKKYIGSKEEQFKKR